MPEIDLEVPAKKHPLLGKIVRLRARNPGRLVHMVTQEELEENRRRRKVANDALKDAETSDAYIIAALRSGAVIEDGYYTAKIGVVERKPHRVKGSSYTRLFVTKVK